ncbi:MAG: hypothetical protein FWE12_06005 [Oscillospiraceae bacterium]|nr:hypothetical protein [Oscillospiraceae bacterium]
MNIQNINFKKVFIVFFAAFFLFSAVSLIFAASDGGWTEAVQIERNHLEARNHVTLREGHTRGWHGHSGHGAMRTNLVESALAETNGMSEEVVTRTRGTENRILHSVARSYVRMTSADFGIFNVFNFLFRAVFTLLLALWVYVDSKKHDRNTILWTAVTLAASIFGFLVYLIVRHVRKSPAASA